jgi:hypothetical protein
MIVLFNPTNEMFSMMYGGISVDLPPGEKRQVEDPCGKHLLNGYGQRGLCQLVYGDVEEKVAAAGRKQNMEFKKTQVVRYNQMNEQRKMQGLGYIPPTPELTQYSSDLAIELREPYNVADQTKSTIATLSNENEMLKQQLQAMQKVISGINDKLAAGDSGRTGSPPVDPKPKRGRPREHVS